MERYVVYYGNGINKVYSNSRNARKHLNDLGGNGVEIYTKNGDFVCKAIRCCDCVVVSTKD